MAKKVVQNTESDVKKKKKKHGCRNCFISLLVFIAIIGVAGYFVGDYFTQKYLDMSLAGCFGVVHDLRSVKPKKIIKNGYGENDYKQFNKEFKQQLFLKDEVDYGVDKLITALIDNMDGGEEEKAAVNIGAKAGGYLSQTASVLNSELDNSGFLTELVQLYVRDNMDIERLYGYDSDEHEKYVMHISDKMFASALNKAINSIGSMDDVKDMLEEFGVETLSDVASIDQIIFGEREGKIQDEQTTVKTVTVTMSMNLRAVATSFLKKATGKNLGFVSKILLPKRMYITVVVPLDSDAEIENSVYINNMNDKKMNRAYKLIDGVTSAAGSDLNIKEKVNETIHDSIGEVMGTVNEVFPLDKAENGVVSFDVYQTVIDLGKINESGGELKPENERITSSDVIGTLAGIVASDPEDGIKEEYDFKHMYFDDASQKAVYVKTANPGADIAGKTWIDYNRLFMDELAAKYALDLTRGTPDNTSDDVTFDDLMRLFGLGDPLEEAKEYELLDLFDSSRLGGILDAPEKRVKVDSRMLGAILQTQLNNNILAGSESLGKYSPELEYVYTYKTFENGANHNKIVAAISINISSALPKDEGLGAIVAGLIGKTAVITFDIDITPDRSEDFYTAGGIAYNGLNEKKTNLILKTISAVVIGFDAKDLISQVEQPLRNTVNKMNEVIAMEICSSKIDPDATPANPPAIEFSDLFETVKLMLFKEDEDITAEGIENVLRELERVNRDGFIESYLAGVELSADGDGNPTYSGSIADITEKYYINGDYTTFDSLFGNSGMLSADFDSDNFDLEKLFRDPASENELRPMFTDGDIAALMIEKMKSEKENGSTLYDRLLKVKGVKISADNSGRIITAVFEISKNDLLDEANSDNLRLLPANTVFLRAKINLDTVYYYNKDSGEKYEGDNPEGYTAYFDTEITLNDMDGDTFGTVRNMLKSLNDKSSEGSKGMDLLKTARDIGAVAYDRLSAVEDAMGGNLRVENGGLRLESVYGYMRGKLLPADSTATAEDVKAAVQGLEEKGAGEHSPHNYDSAGIVVNTIAKTADITVEGGKITMDDNSFGRALAGGFTVDLGAVQYTSPSVIGSDERYELVQLNILHGSPGSRGEFLESYDGALQQGKTYIEFTFEANARQLGSGDFTSALPEKIYVTVLFRYENGKFVYEFFRINELDADRQNVLLELAGINEQNDIQPQVTECEEALSKYEGAEFGSIDGGSGFGYISFTPNVF